MLKVFKIADKIFLSSFFILVVLGFFIFLSASFGSLHDMKFFLSLTLKQLISIFLGILVFYFLAYSKKINEKCFRKYSVWIFFITLIIQLLVFFPGLGIEIKGATRWLDLGFLTIQPSEILKLGIVVFAPALVLAFVENFYKNKFFNLLLFLTIFTIPLFLIFFFIKDFGTLTTILFSIFSVILVSKVKFTHTLFSAFLGILFLFILIFFLVPHGKERIENFLGSEEDPLGSSFHTNQSIMTIGSGEILGIGFGKSLQKFDYLPEPLGDSIFAVYAEEKGFLGSVFFLLVFMVFTGRGLYLSYKNKNKYSRLVSVGIISLIVFPVFLNIASVLKLFPLSGLPINFVSKGGSAILISIILVGIFINLNRKIRV